MIVSFTKRAAIVLRSWWRGGSAPTPTSLPSGLACFPSFNRWEIINLTAPHPIISDPGYHDIQVGDSIVAPLPLCWSRYTFTTLLVPLKWRACAVCSLPAATASSLATWLDTRYHVLLQAPPKKRLERLVKLRKTKKSQIISTQELIFYLWQSLDRDILIISVLTRKSNLKASCFSVLIRNTTAVVLTVSVRRWSRQLWFRIASFPLLRVTTKNHQIYTKLVTLAFKHLLYK